MRRMTQRDIARIERRNAAQAQQRAAATYQRKRAGKKGVATAVATVASGAAAAFLGDYKLGPLPYIAFVGVAGAVAEVAIPERRRSIAGESAIKSAEYMLPAGVAIAAYDTVGGRLPFGGNGTT